MTDGVAQNRHRALNGARHDVSVMNLPESKHVRSWPGNAIHDLLKRPAGQLPALDGLRAAAVLFVICDHWVYEWVTIAHNAQSFASAAALSVAANCECALPMTPMRERLLAFSDMMRFSKLRCTLRHKPYKPQ